MYFVFAISYPSCHHESEVEAMWVSILGSRLLHILLIHPHLFIILNAKVTVIKGNNYCEGIRGQQLTGCGS